ncbi:MAG: zf-HC2 domain-containing protein [Planctomycetota bacterium]|nr:zf-HC2 domain-containing protein [Planctomycetota bacterium]
MECKDARRMVQLYLAGDSDANLEMVKEHITKCKECEAFYEDALKLEQIMTDALSPLKESPAEQVMKRVEEVKFSFHRRWRRTVYFVSIIVMLSAIVLFLSYFGLLLAYRRMKVRQELEMIKKAVVLYVQRGENLPESETEAVWTAVAKENWAQNKRLDSKRRQYLDPWGNSYRLIRGKDFWLVVSGGRNGKFEYGAGDDYALRFTTPK